MSAISLRPLLALLLLLMMLMLAAPRPCAGKKRLSSKELDLARAYGYTEREISKLRGGEGVAPLAGCSDPKSADFFSRFRRLEEIDAFVTQRLCALRAEIGSQGSSCKVVDIGRSVQGRVLWAVELRNPEAQAAAAAARASASAKASARASASASASASDSKRAKKSQLHKAKERLALVTGTVHAREWTGTTSALLAALRADVTDVGLLVVPVVNPDGYAYTWSGGKQLKKKFWKGEVVEEMVDARYWRKNRRINPDGTLGVDLNRNFGSKKSGVWGTEHKLKSINLTESDVYQGTAGFSEPETAALRDYLARYRGRIVSAYDLHCCIGALLEPFAVNAQGKAPDFVFDVGQVVLEAINTKTPPDAPYEWRPRPAASSSGSGISSNFFFNEAKIPFTFVVEIRGKFLERCSEIKPIGNEVLAGLNALLRQLTDMDAIVAAHEAEAHTKPRLKKKKALQDGSSGSSGSQMTETAGAAGRASVRTTLLYVLGGAGLLIVGYLAKTKTEKIT